MRKKGSGREQGREERGENGSGVARWRGAGGWRDADGRDAGG